MLYAVIMAGGSGTRFWPRSRKKRPKQILRIVGDNSMIRATVERILPQIPMERIMVVTGESHAEEIRAQLPELSNEMIVAEPWGLNTAPCIALAAYKLIKQDPEAVMVVLPADHLIRKEQEFLEILGTASKAAGTGDYLITFGIVPERPETGYGYIERGDPMLNLDAVDVFNVRRFVEKPDMATAREYLVQGNYLWNSGMFMWQASAIIKAFEKHLPTISRTMETILPALNGPEEAAAIREAYGRMESISIDYGIMEKADQVLVIEADVAWNDVGSWRSLEDVWGTDQDGNALSGDLVSLDSRGCTVSSPHKLTTLIGVKDLIVVDTQDALLICDKDRAQDVKALLDILKKKGYDELL